MEEGMARALVAADITLLEELAYVPTAELLAIEGLQESEVHEFRQKARAYLLSQALEGKDLPPGWLRDED